MPRCPFPAVPCLLAGGIALLPVETRAGGVTLITHGFNSNVTSWIIPMAEQLAGHPGFGGTEVTCYRVEVSKSGSDYLYSATRLAGPVPSASDSGEIAVKLDWSTIDDDFGTSASDVAAAAAAALVDPGLLAELDGHPLAELPLHFLGHSRGSSVISEMARELGRLGIWVDHLSFLDPVPVGLYGDPAVEVWETVLYADNFYQTIGGFLVPTGSAVTGAFNRRLTELGGGYPGASGNHSDPHLWYHATIDLATPSSDTQASITASERTSWWESAEAAGATAGFHYSRIGGGDRLSTLVPVPATSDAIDDGYNRQWDLGGGVTGNRSIVAGRTDQWPNLVTLSHGATSPIGEGGTIPISGHYQGDAGDLVVTPFLDPDRNPWNDNAIELAPETLGGTGPAAVLPLNLLAGTPAAAGSFHLGARIEQGGRRRFLYAGEPLTILPAARIEAGSLRFEAGLFTFTILGTPGQTVEILASDELETWLPIDSITLEGSTADFSDPGSGGVSRRYYRLSPP